MATLVIQVTEAMSPTILATILTHATQVSSLTTIPIQLYRQCGLEDTVL